MTKPKKLIEVAMPVKEISAESVRDKSIRHGHISTLHLWWARRPLPVCRAVVFASLVPDPLDENCPEQFKEAVDLLLGKDNDLPGDPYKPYEDIPHTAVVDKMEDNLRNRLMMFIGKFSDKYVQNERLGKKTSAKDQLHHFSLVKWDNKNDDKIIGRARKLIFVSHNTNSGKSVKELLLEYEDLNLAIKNAENNLYSFPNRHIETDEVKALEKEKNDAIASFLSKMPKVFDPFAGGGAIPLEAARLGCNSYGNDLNPVAHIVQKGSCEFPQKYGKPISFNKEEFIKIYGKNELEKQKVEGNLFGEEVNIANRLAHDVEFYSSKILSKLERLTDYVYHRNSNNEKPIVYYWARLGRCMNPSCGAKVPMLKHMYLSKRRNTDKKNWIYIEPKISKDKIDYAIKNGESEDIQFNNRGNLKCPCCGSVTPKSEIKKQAVNGEFNPYLLALIYQTKSGKKFLKPTNKERDLIENLPIAQEVVGNMQRNSAGGDTFSWGINRWTQLFTNRQLIVLNEFKNCIKEFSPKNLESEYLIVIKLYLTLLFDRLLMRYTAFNTWHLQQDTVEKLFSRQAVPIVFDFPEMNPFTDYTSSASSQISSIVNYIVEESHNSFFSNIYNPSPSQEIKPSFVFDYTITDPPYYDAIAYADISDFFYVWIKDILANDFSLTFSTPQTPKIDECTALKHHHNGSLENANLHFEDLLTEIFKNVNKYTNDTVSIMFAHQTTKAWTTLCNSILSSNMNIRGSWPIETESTAGLKNKKDYLASSITVTCKPSLKSGIGDYKEVKEEILKVIKNEVDLLYSLGFRGADLLTACFGQAVSVFGRYESVEKADGSEVTVAELLEMAREAAFDAIVSDIATDDLTKFYIGWLNLFGFSEAIHDDVRRISQIGLNVDISEIYDNNILVKEGDKGTLGDAKSRINLDVRLGLRPVNNTDIDIAHRLMYLFDPKTGNRKDLLDYIASKAPNTETTVWRVLNSLVELLPKSKDFNDRELAMELLSNQDNLIKEAKNRKEASRVQGSLDFE